MPQNFETKLICYSDDFLKIGYMFPMFQDRFFVINAIFLPKMDTKIAFYKQKNLLDESELIF